MTRCLLLALALGCTSEVRDPSQASVGHVAHVRAGVHCQRCHKGMSQADSAAAVHLPDDPICVECHAEVHRDDGRTGSCVSCHVDPDTVPTLRRMGEALVFSHAAHLPRVKGECVGCHRGAVEPNGRGAVPAMADCAGCHQPWLDQIRCEECHLSMAAYPLVPITHQAHTADFTRQHGAAALTGGDRCASCHAQSFCAECHDGNAPLAAGAMWPDRPDREFIHRANYLERHASEARLEGPACVGCHGVEQCRGCHTAAGRGLGDLSPHPRGWASPGPGENLHAQAAHRDLLSCASCHGGSAGDLCADCHGVGRPGGSPHGGQKPPGDPRRDRPCVACHGGRR